MKEYLIQVVVDSEWLMVPFSKTSKLRTDHPLELIMQWTQEVGERIVKNLGRLGAKDVRVQWTFVYESE